MVIDPSGNHSSRRQPHPRGLSATVLLVCVLMERARAGMPPVPACRERLAPERRTPEASGRPTQLHLSAGAGFAHSRHFAVGRDEPLPSDIVDRYPSQRLGPNLGGGAERGTGGCWSNGLVVVRLVAGIGSGVAGVLVRRFR